MTTKEIKVPNIGGANDVEVIEVIVKPGDQVKKDDSLITLESDKASMEIPAPESGIVEKIQVKLGDKVSEGSVILMLKPAVPAKEPTKEASKPEVSEAAIEKAPDPKQPQRAEQPVPAKAASVSTSVESSVDDGSHAGPAVRRLAREFGIDLQSIKGSGPKGRILTEDLQSYVRKAVNQGLVTGGDAFAIPKVPEVDFSKFGEIEKIPLTKIKKLTGIHVHRSWISIPHVTQFDQADITDLEEFRKSNKTKAEKEGVKLTPLVFIMKAVVAALKAYPNFNASLDTTGETLILKKYFNLGIAVDTPDGLVVPVVKNVDQKGMLELAKELAQVSSKARKKSLTPADMSGSCFTISSLGGIGGTAFTPIVNAPDVAILGVSKASLFPVYKQGQLVPRLLLPLSLSYDHRVIDGADGARFLVFLANCLSDIRTLLL